MLPRLANIYTYPIKSCAANSHTHIALDDYGLEWDRHWMIVDQDGKCVTQREFSSLALVQPTLEQEFLRLSAPNMSDILIPLARKATSTRIVNVWDDLCSAWDEGDDLATWLSDYLHDNVRLVRKSHNFQRPVDARYATRAAHTTFTDGYPVLLVSQAALDELNTRLVERSSDPIPMSRFRPNFVISECEAFAEDTWKTVQIGSLTFDIVKPCARCVTTTVDQATGTVPDVHEPIATLNTFRKQGNKVMFAQNAIHHAPGMVSAGDPVTILVKNISIAINA